MNVTVQMVKAVRAHAIANYTSGGWDYVVEAYSDRELTDILVETGATTEAQAIKAVAKVVGVVAEQRDEARALGGVEAEREAAERERRDARRPAEKGDFRFEVIPIPEPEMGCTHVVEMIDDSGAVVESFTTDDPFGAVEAFRETQEFSFEERMEMYAQRGW